MNLNRTETSNARRHLVILNILFLAGIFSLIILTINSPFKRATTQENQNNTWMANTVGLAILPPFSLVSQDGEQITNAHLLGKIWVANFIFTRCTASCPKMSAQMASLQNTYRGDPDIKLVSFSVDPEYDTEMILHEFANSYSAEKGQWFFLTGSRNQIYSLAHDFFHLGAGPLSDKDKEMGAEEVLHSERFVLLNPQSQILGYYDGMSEESMANLKSEIERLKKNIPA